MFRSIEERKEFTFFPDNRRIVFICRFDFIGTTDGCDGCFVALPIESNRSLWGSKNGPRIRVLIQKVTNLSG